MFSTLKYHKIFQHAALALAIAMAALVAVPAAAVAGYKVVDYRVGAHADKTRIVFDLAGQGRYTVARLHDPERLLIEYPQSRGGLRFTRKTINKGLIQRIRTGHGKGRSDYRVVLDLKQPVTYEVFTLAGRKRGTRRLVVDLFPSSGAIPGGKRPTSSRPALPASPVRSEELGNDEEMDIITSMNALKHRRTRSARSVAIRPGLSTRPAGRLSGNEMIRLRREILKLTRRPLDDNKIIVAIDAGHGGVDTGAIGYRGIREKDITLRMAKKLKRQIDSLPNMRAILVRKGDVKIPLAMRPAIAARRNADLFISLHADSYPHSRRVRGATVYVHSRKPSSRLAALIAKSENGEIKLHPKRGGAKKVAYILDRVTRSTNVRVSRKMGAYVLKEMGRVTRLHKRKVQSANYAVLREARIPAILIEMGYVSNPQDARNLRSWKFQNKLARAIAKGVHRFAYRRANQPYWGEQLYAEYHVRKGDTLAKVAKKFGTTVSRLKRLNGMKSLRLRAGQKLKVPLPLRRAA